MPFEVTDPEAPVTQAQLAVMFKAILDAARLQTPSQVLGGTSSHASTSRRSRPATSRRPFQGITNARRQAGSHAETNQAPNRNVHQRLGARVQPSRQSQEPSHNMPYQAREDGNQEDESVIWKGRILTTTGHQNYDRWI